MIVVAAYCTIGIDQQMDLPPMQTDLDPLYIIVVHAHCLVYMDTTDCTLEMCAASMTLSHLRGPGG